MFKGTEITSCGAPSHKWRPTSREDANLAKLMCFKIQISKFMVKGAAGKYRSSYDNLPNDRTIKPQHPIFISLITSLQSNANMQVCKVQVHSKTECFSTRKGLHRAWISLGHPPPKLTHQDSSHRHPCKWLQQLNVYHYEKKAPSAFILTHPARSEERRVGKECLL